jgi:hypothetical protein
MGVVVVAKEKALASKNGLGSVTVGLATAYRGQQ